MHKFVLPIAATVAALAFSTPAAAQYYPVQPSPAPRYGYGYGDWQQVRQLRMRIDAIRHQIDALDRRDAIAGRTADRLLDQANRLDRRLSDRARRGLDPREAGEIQYRVQRLEQQVQWARGARWERFGDWR